MEPTSLLKVSGVYDRREVNVGFSRCGDPDMGGWERLLPTETLSEVSIDRGIGPFRLGESESAARALLAARAPIGTAGGIDVYKPEGGSDGLISVSCGDRLHQDHLIMAFRYDSARGLVTVIGNLETLRLDAYTMRVGALASRCEDEREQPPVPRSPGLLNSWIPVTCGGREALVDHPLNEGPTPQDTTVVVPALLPLVIVTSDPTSACEDAARLHREFGA